MRTLIKKTITLRQAGESEKARETFREAQQSIDKAIKRGVIKERTGSRRKATLAQAIKPEQE